MGTIQILDLSVANLIAAGEVVDRPASAIKEMMENSIDAGATEITVEIKNGGSSFMRVTDNGCGMDPDDARTCVHRHATSKVRTANDLGCIQTLGFRGEALAAIASVTDFRILTRKQGAEMGTLVRCENGAIVEFHPTGCPEGTTVIAEALFANIPARRKFLKKDMTETGAVAAVVEKIALSRPDIAIRLITDEKTKFATAGDGKLLHAIHAILGRDFAKKTVPVDDMTEGIRIHGYIGRPDNVRGNRNYQNFFINGRYIKSTTAAMALEQAFHSYCPAERFPCCVLHIEIHPTLVDVNVHPAKLEVKFANEKFLFHAVYCAVRNALTQGMHRPETQGAFRLAGDDLKGLEDVIKDRAESAEVAAQIALDREKLTGPYRQISAFEQPDHRRAQESTVTVEVDTPQDALSAPVPAPTLEPSAHGKEREQAQDEPLLSIPPVVAWKQLPSEREVESHAPTPTFSPNLIGFAVDAPSDFSLTFDTQLRDHAAPVPPEPTVPPTPPVPTAPTCAPNGQPSTNLHPLPNYHIGGVLFQCYIVVELEDKMLLIDKHAAHERILYEQLKANMERMESTAQLLLIPIPVTLTPLEIAAAAEYDPEIHAIGFDFLPTADIASLSLVQIPSELDATGAAEAFRTLLGNLADGTITAQISRQTHCEKALFQAACKAAVKAGKEDNEGHIRWITEQVLTRDDIRFCPHGRPVALEMTKSEVEHLFHRP